MRLNSLRWLILGLLFLATVIHYLDRQALSVLLPTLRVDLGLTSAVYGNITMVFMLAYTIAQLVAGLVVDRIGARRSFSVFIAGWSLAALAHAFVRGALSLGVLRCLLALSEAGNWPAGVKVVARWFPAHRRGMAMAVFDSGAALGAMLAPPLVAFLALQFGWRAAFAGTAVLGFVWLLGWWKVYDEPERHGWLAPEDREALLAEVGAETKRASSFGACLGGIVAAGVTWGMVLTRFLATPVWWFYVFWLPDYLSKARNFSLAEIGFYGWIPYLTVDLGKVGGGLASDRLLEAGMRPRRARKIVMVSGGLMMSAGLMVVEAPTAAAAVGWVCLATFGFGIWSANIYALHADIFPGRVLATAIGFTGMGSSLGGAVFTCAVGLLVDKAGYGPVFWAVGIIPLLACATLVLCVGGFAKKDELVR